MWKNVWVSRSCSDGMERTRSGCARRCRSWWSSFFSLIWWMEFVLLSKWRSRSINKKKKEKKRRDPKIILFPISIDESPSLQLQSLSPKIEMRNAFGFLLSIDAWKEWEVVSILLAWRARAVSLYFLLSPLEFPAHTNSIFSVRHIAVSTAFSSIGESSDCLNCAWSISRAMWEQMRKKEVWKSGRDQCSVSISISFYYCCWYKTICHVITYHLNLFSIGVRPA